jgi:hypothetical protein
MKRITVMSIEFIVMMLLCIVLCPNHIQAASKKSKAMAAYNKYLSAGTIHWKDTSGNDLSSWTDTTGKKRTTYLDSGKCKFLLAYINNDTIPELIIYQTEVNYSVHSVGDFMILTYKGGKVKYVGTISSVGDSCGKFLYYKKKSVIIDNDYMGGRNYDDYYCWTGNKLTSFAGTVTHYADEIGINNNGKITYNLSDSQEEVSKKTFNQLLKKYVGKTKLTKAKFYKNNAGNRKKYLK